MGKTKQFVRPPKKQKPKATIPETADDFQEAADREEETGGKWRAGDPAKSGRAFVRALEMYDKGLQKHPNSFDLAYNKARLELDITQHPALVEHIGLPLVDLLKQTLQSHRYALRLNEENADVLFNTSQVLTSLAEQFSEIGQSFEAIPLLQEALELLSSCLSKQEMQLEQQTMDFEDVEDGGVELDPEEKPASSSGSDEEQTALVETPLTANDLLDTVHASLSALTTLVPLVDEAALQTYGDMAHMLTEKRAPSYVSILPADLQDTARFSLALDRAIFVSAFTDAQYSFYMLDVDTYLDRLSAFDITGKEQNAQLLCAEAEARTEFGLSVIDRFESSPDLPAETCWKQLGISQDLYSKVTKLDSDEAKERKPEVYESKGSVELIRHRLISTANVKLSDSIKNSGATLIQNAQTYFKGSAQLARADGDQELEEKSKMRWLIATDIGAMLYGVQPKEPPFEGNPATIRDELARALEDCVDEGIVGTALGEEILKRIRQ